MTLLKPDICVIGAGSGGLSVAAASALFGVPVVLIEKDRMGGDCLNVGCVPSKALIAAGERAQAMRETAAFGIAPAEPSVDMGKVRAHIRSTIAGIAPTDSVERFTALGVQVIQGEAVFEDPRTVVVGTTRVQARRFVIATGSRPAVPPIPGLERTNYYTNETIFEVGRAIDHLVVIGAGPIGLELAQAHRRLGAKVTVLEAGNVLGREDPELADVVQRRLAAEGVTVHAQANITLVEAKGQGASLAVTLADGTETVLEASHLLVAAGRKPTIAGLGLEAAGIATERGGIKVDKGLRTANRRVYAIGDCAVPPGGPIAFTHAANYHAGLVLRSALFRQPVSVNHDLVPRVTYTDPEIAAVGLDEQSARQAHGKVTILRWPFAENDRAHAEHQREGHVKAIIGKRGRILGVGIVGAHAGELVSPWTLAMAKGLKISDMTGFVVPYPTLSEVTRRTALTYLLPSASNPWVRWLIGFLRRFG